MTDLTCELKQNVFLSKPDELRQMFLQLSKHELEQLEKIRKACYVEKYGKRTDTLYENLPRCFTKEQLVIFFRTFPSDRPQVKKILLRQFFYGLRIGEAEKATLVESHGLVRVETEKRGKGKRVVNFLPVIKGTECLFKDIVKQVPSKSDKYSSNYLRNVFTTHCKSLGSGFNFSYVHDKAGKKRHQFTTHTLRHTAGNMFADFTNDIFKEKVYLRHSTTRAFGATSIYRRYDLEAMRKDLNECFGSLVEELL